MAIAIPVIGAAGLSGYDELVSLITQTLNRTNYTSSIPSFIAMCEAEMNRRLALKPVIPMQIVGTLSIASEYVVAPSRLLDIDSIVIPDEGPVKATTTQNIANQPISTAAPSLYARVGSSLQFYPVPTTTYTANIVYWQKLAPLSETTNSNWLFADHPDAYFHGALFYAYETEKDEANRDHHLSVFDAIMDRVLDAYPSRTDNAPLRCDPALTVRTCLA